MDYKLEVVVVPVSDVDRAKRFYAEQVGFVVDVDHQPNEHFRVVQLTPPGSGCSITIGKGIDRLGARVAQRPPAVRRRHRGRARRPASRGASPVSSIQHHDGSGVRRGQGRGLQLVHVLRRPGRQLVGDPGEPDRSDGGEGRRPPRRATD